MSCTCAPALRTLRSQLNSAYPNRDRASDGCCADARHEGIRSDHNPTNGYAHALDIDEDLEPGRGDKPLLGWIPQLLTDGRVRYIIYEARIYYVACKIHGSLCFSAGGHDYDGANAHDKHLHISIKTDTTFLTHPWALPPTASQPSQTKENDMTPALVAKPGADRLDAFVVGEDMAVWWRRSEGAGWSDWQSLGGAGFSGVTAAWRGNSLVIAVKGGDGALWHKYSTDGYNWSEWTSLGGKIA